MTKMYIDVNQERKKTIVFSFWPIKFILGGMVVGPFIGLLITFADESTLLGVKVTLDLLISYALYLLVVIACLFLAPNKVNYSLPIINGETTINYLKRIRVLGILCMIFNFVISGQYILRGQMARGDVRISLGLLGPVNSWIILYFLPCIAFLATTYLLVDKTNRHSSFEVRKLFYQILAAILMTGLMTGYKFVTLMMFLPSISLVWSNISVKTKATTMLVALFIPTISHFLFSKTSADATFIDSSYYVLARSTIVAAYGAAAAWEYAQHHTTPLISQILLSMFGKQLVASTLSQGNPIQDIGQLVTIEYYPDLSGAQSGTVNLTLTFFGEAVNFFQETWIIAAILFFTIIVFLFKTMYRSLKDTKTSFFVAIMMLTISCVIPIINSGGMFGLISLYTFLYTTSLYFLSKRLIPSKWNH